MRRRVRGERKGEEEEKVREDKKVIVITAADDVNDKVLLLYIKKIYGQTRIQNTSSNIDKYNTLN